MKDPVKRMKSQATDIEKIFANHIFADANFLEYKKTHQMNDKK